jgi:hypothetical protein
MNTLYNLGGNMINLRAIWQLAGYSIGIGAVVGAGLGAWAGSRFFGGGGALAGLFLGALLGATTGLDMVLVPPTFAGSRQIQKTPPFTWATICVLGGITALLLAFYTWGSITLTCQRNGVGRVDCERATTVWLGRVQDNGTLFPGVSRAQQSTSDLVLLTTTESSPGFLYGLPPDTGAQITRFLDSKEATLQINNNSLWFFPLIFAVAGIVLLPFSIPAFRSAQRKLEEKLERGARVSGRSASRRG